MARRGAVVRRSGVEWGVRIMLATLLAALGYIAVMQSAGNVLRTRNPALAHRLAPGDGRITANLSEALLLGNPVAAQHTDAGQLARLALRQDPIAVPAVVTLGLMAQLSGDVAQARRLFGFSDRLTRRDQQAHIWAIEDAVARGNIPAALRRYDLALRTSRTAPDLLFPVLAAASSEPAVMRELVRTLAAPPPWGANFIDYVAGSGPDALATGRLMWTLLKVGVPVSAPARAVTVSRLMTHDAVADAWAFYAASHHGANPRMSRDPHFTGDFLAPTPFDWVLTQDPGLTVSVQRGDRGGVLDFAAPGGVGGIVVQQVQLLPPGDYRLDGHSIAINQRPSSRPYWVLTCPNNQELARITVPNSDHAGGRFSGQLRVPANCPLQRLALIARSSDSVSGTGGQIDWMQLRPLVD